MYFKSRFLARSVVAASVLSGSLYAAEYANTSFYVAYDNADKTQYALVMPSVNKIYTHKAGQIQAEDLTQIDNQFSSFPAYNNGELCFPALKEGATGDGGASTMANHCYDVNFYYIQKEIIPAGAAFMLYYDTGERVYEGLAGKPDTFLVVKDGEMINNENSITEDNYKNFSFDHTTATATIADSATKPQETLPNSITGAMTLTKDKLWLMDGLVVVESGATLTIEPGTTIAGYDGTGEQTSYMIVDKGAKIIADGTQTEPIVFTSTKTAIDGEAPAVGQWGGLTIIGHAANDQVKAYEVNADFVADATNMEDNSGILRYVKILNSGITMEVDKEINGLSMVGVGSGTVVENITVDLSDDDGIELWGGTVNLTNVNITRCTDDYFDVDDGFSGIVKNLNITTTTGNAAVEMSGTTHATFDGFNIVQNGSAKEGGIYFKGDGIGGHFMNGTIADNVNDTYGAFYSMSGDKTSDTVDAANTSFANVTIEGTSTGARFTGTSAATLEGIYNEGNTKPQETLPNSITGAMTLTKDKLWLMDGLVVVESGATLTIEPGTTIAGYDGTGEQTSYMIVDKGAKIIADGTQTEPIVFTSTKTAIDGEAPAVGQWGGLTIIGHAANDQVKAYEVNADFVADATNMEDNSGILRYVKILNSGITMEVDKEINGLSMVGVGSGTVVENITVDLSDDDGIELWGGTVNLTNVNITRCTDDYFDVDDGFSGIVKNLNITTTTGNAAVEMSGTTHATFDGFNIVQNGSAKEGGIYFKGDGIGGHFMNGTIADNVNDTYGAFYSMSGDKTSDTVDAANTSFANVTIEGTSTGARFTGTSAATLEGIFDNGTENTK